MTLTWWAYLRSHGIEVGKCKEHSDGRRLWELNRCPWRPTERDGGAFVQQFANGHIIARCKHNQCAGKGWDDLRDVIDPGWRDKTEKATKKGSKKGPSIVEQCIAVAATDELFHTPDQEAYASVYRDNHRETWRVKGKQYKLLLRGRLHAKGVVATAPQ